MSALGHKQTLALQQTMSALPPKADICSALAHVRYGPIADLDLFDHLVSSREQVIRWIDAKRLGRLEVDDKLKLGRILDRQIG
jgi:hypothetical protein